MPDLKHLESSASTNVIYLHIEEVDLRFVEFCLVVLISSYILISSLHHL